MNRHTARLTHNARLAGMALSDVWVTVARRSRGGECLVVRADAVRDDDDRVLSLPLPEGEARRLARTLGVR